VGVPFGYLRAHTQDYGALGLSLGVDPEWTSRITFDGGLIVGMAEQPVYLTRWEAETRITRAVVAARRDFFPDWMARPILTAGAFTEPSIVPIGPYLGAGATYRVKRFAIDFVLATAVYPQDKLGHLSFEVLLQPRLLHPLREAGPEGRPQESSS
jgi:hypothetical protein